MSLSKQILVTRESNPVTISNFLFNQIELACMNYGINDLAKFTVVLKFRPLALREDIVEEIPKIKYNIKETQINRNVSLIKSKFYNGTILPLSMNLGLYGETLSKMLKIFYILKYNLNPDGHFFKKEEFVIYVNITDLKHEGIIFKNKAVFYKFEDVLIEGNSFIRTTNKYIFYIENFNISYFEKLSLNSFITKSKPNAKLNSNIVTFDIETYVKDGKFVPFACGWYDGEFLRSYYLTDFKAPAEMLLSALAEMLEFKMLLTKLGIKLYYTDTDSIFIDKDLPQHLIGNELGLMNLQLDFLKTLVN